MKGASRSRKSSKASYIRLIAGALTAALAASAAAAKQPPPGFRAPFFSHGASTTTTTGNSYVEIAITEPGLFTIGTRIGDSERSSDDNKDLLYGHPSPWSSYSTVRVDGTNYRFGTDGSHTSGITSGGSFVSTTWRIAGAIDVTQTLSIVPSRGTDNADTVEIRYRFRNIDSAAHSVGLRVMLDTLLGDNDGAPFRVPGVGSVTQDREFDSIAASTTPAIPAQAVVLDRLSDPKVVALFSFQDASLTAPDRAIFGYWPTATNNDWDYLVDETRTITSDTALIVYWGYYNAITLAAGQSLDMGFYYGLGGYSTAADGNVVAGLVSPARLTVSVTSNSFVYSPDPVTLTAFIQNLTVGNVGGTASLGLPSGFTLDPSYASVRAVEKPTGTAVLGGGQDAEISWQARANGRKSGYLSFAVAVNTGLEPLVVSRRLYVPGIPNAIWGVMSDQAGLPIPGVTLTAYEGGAFLAGQPQPAPGMRPALGAQVGSAVSQSDGKYIIPNLSPGAYTVAAAGGGIQPTYFTAQVAADESGEAANPLNESPAAAVETYAYPNPAREGSAQIRFFAPSAGDATIRIYNGAGELILSRSVGAVGAGWWNVPWDIDGVANGVYFYSVELGGQSGRGKIAVVKRRGR